MRTLKWALLLSCVLVATATMQSGAKQFVRPAPGQAGRENRATSMTINNGILKVLTNVAATKLAIHAGFGNIDVQSLVVRRRRRFRMRSSTAGWVWK